MQAVFHRRRTAGTKCSRARSLVGERPRRPWRRCKVRLRNRRRFVGHWWLENAAAVSCSATYRPMRAAPRKCEKRSKKDRKRENAHKNEQAVLPADRRNRFSMIRLFV